VSWSTALAWSRLIGSPQSPIAWSKSSPTPVSIPTHEVKATVSSIRRYPAMSVDPLDAALSIQKETQPVSDRAITNS